MMIIHADCKTCGVHFHYERHSGGGAFRKYCDQHSYSDSAVAARNEGRCCVVCGTDISSRHGTAIVCSRECSKRRVSDLKKERRKFTVRVVSSVCKECGSEFSYAKTWKGNIREICSDDCRSTIYRRLQARLKAERDKKRQTEAFKRFDEKASKIKQKADSLRRECTYCGVAFTPVGYNSRGHFVGFPKRTMCGKGCSTKAAADAARDKISGVRAGDAGYPEARAKSDMVRREITAIRRIASRKGFIKQKTDCPCCGKTFVPRVVGQVNCSKGCTVSAGAAAGGLRRWEEEVRGKTKECKCCGAQYCMTYKAKAMSFCSRKCRTRYYLDRPKDRGDKRAHERRREARKAARRTGRVVPIEICERDNWQCQGCGIDTPQELRGTHEPNAPELDHILPLALEGTHGPENIQLLCRACNHDKADKHPSEWVPPMLLMGGRGEGSFQRLLLDTDVEGLISYPATKKVSRVTNEQARQKILGGAFGCLQ